MVDLSYKQLFKTQETWLQNFLTQICDTASQPTSDHPGGDPTDMHDMTLELNTRSRLFEQAIAGVFARSCFLAFMIAHPDGSSLSNCSSPGSW